MESKHQMTLKMKKMTRNHLFYILVTLFAMFYLLKLYLNFSNNCISPHGCTASGQFVLFSFENFIKMIKHLWFLIFGLLSRNGLGQMVISPVDLPKIEPDAIVPELELNQGVVRGKRYSDLGVEIFTGIPYAQVWFLIYYGSLKFCKL